MTFVQILSFHTDDLDALNALEDRWLEETEGRRTVVDGALYRDRNDPEHYVAVNYFASWEDARTNSALPETDRLAREAGALATGPVEFTDLDLVSGGDQRVRAAELLRDYLISPDSGEGVFTDDVVVDMWVPHGRSVAHGREMIRDGMATEGPGRTIEQWDVATLPEGFLAEYAYRTVEDAEHPTILSVGTVVARLRHGKVAELRLHCAGNWTPEHEAEVEQAVGLPATSRATHAVPA